jgi:hypothetical protein
MNKEQYAKLAEAGVEPFRISNAATSEWMEPTLVNIREDAWYLVQTNGGEWRDADLFVMRGIAVALRLKPEIVRGRPKRIARINLSD